MNPLEQYPAARRIVYALFWVAGLVVGSVQVWAVAVETTTPAWVKGAQAVLAFLAIPIGYTAAQNIVEKQKVAATEPDPENAPGAYEAGPAADVPVGTPVAVESFPPIPDPAEAEMPLETPGTGS
ncbi:MAG: hypothetical protein HOV66_07780 [Streptomycetaceae bacterium]|nr:hypothetical protein [Streptomycetaceae bacterium]